MNRRPAVKLSSVLVLIAGCAVLNGCASFGTGHRASVDYDGKVRKLSRELQRSNDKLEDLKAQNMVLKTKLKLKARQEITESLNVVSELPKAEPATVVTAAPVAETAAVAQKSAGDVGEQMIYSKVIDTYRMREVAELKKSVQILLKAYPDSIYADNALFLAGSLAFELGDLPYARLQMERLINEYPNSNKAVSALFAKAVIEKRERHFQAARQGLMTIKNKFPGSPEALRVNVELKLMGLMATPSKKRES
jgi:TolA-binding protein